MAVEASSGSTGRNKKYFKLREGNVCLTCRVQARSIVTRETACRQHEQSIEEDQVSGAVGAGSPQSGEERSGLSGGARRDQARRARCSRCRTGAHGRERGTEHELDLWWDAGSTREQTLVQPGAGVGPPRGSGLGSDL